MFWKAFMGVEEEPDVCMEAGRSLLASQFLHSRASEEGQQTGRKDPARLRILTKYYIP